MDKIIRISGSTQEIIAEKYDLTPDWNRLLDRATKKIYARCTKYTITFFSLTGKTVYLQFITDYRVF